MVNNMDNDKNEFLERLKKYNEDKTRIEEQNQKNNDTISDEIIRNSIPYEKNHDKEVER